MAILGLARCVLIHGGRVFPALRCMQEPRFGFARERVTSRFVQALERVFWGRHQLKYVSSVERKGATFQVVIDCGLQTEERLEAEHVVALRIGRT